MSATDAAKERRRIVGLLLAEWAHYQNIGKGEIADALDMLALRIEHGDEATRDIEVRS